ncbi:MAG: YceI family protein [Flavipsychrobacter sp.]|jgi:polyisoprenoid-binding protein YceI|nr:YceI family protein [Flavipsychrobacter sp.]
MKKMMIVAVLVCSSTTLFAQKYMTRTGKASFFSSTPLENIEAFNNEVAGVVDSKSGDIAFQVPIKSFKFEKALMQEHFNENYMESDKFPKAEFKGKVADIGSVNFSKDGTYNVKSTGKLTIHGVTRDVTLPGTVTVKGNTATVSSKFSVKTADHNIAIPKLVEGKIAKQIEVTVNSILTQK